MNYRLLKSQNEMIAEMNAWEIWRAIEPSAIQRHSYLTILVWKRVKSALASTIGVYPKVDGHLREITRQCDRSWLPALAGLPIDEGQGQVARLDVRMTIVLASWLVPMVSGRMYGPNPFAPRLFSRALLDLAEMLPRPAAVLYSVPRRDWNEKDRDAVRDWRRLRRQCLRLSMEWTRHDVMTSALGKDRQSQKFTVSLFLEALEKTSDSSFPTPMEGEFTEKEAAALQAAGEAGEATSRPESAPSVPKRTVLATIPEFRSGRDAMSKSEQERWQALASPVPLAAPERPEAIIDALKREFPWMSPAIDHVRLDLALTWFRPEGGWFHLRPLLLVGPPGCGKTRFARRLAELAGLHFRAVNAGGSGDNRDLQGTARAWSTAEPSAALRAIKDGGIANPLILVDEIEKAGASRHNGRIVDTLLSLLEAETARAWYDECLCVAADLTAINWIVTANTLAGIPEPLRNRLTIVQVGHPGAADFNAILGGIRQEIAGDLGIEPFALPELLPEVEKELAAAFRSGTSIRKIRAAVLSACGAALAAPRVLH